MKITYSTAADRTKAASETRKTGRRGVEMLALACTSVISLLGLLLVFNAKLASVADAGAQLAAHHIVDLSRVQSAAELVPALTTIPDSGQRRVIADRVYEAITTADSGGRRPALDSVAALGRVTVPVTDVLRDRRLAFLRDRVKPSTGAHDTTGETERTVRLLTPAQVADLKPAFVVRSTSDYRWAFGVAVAIFLAGFWAVHLLAQVRGRRSDALLLPIVQLLCAMGLIAMITLRDPLRDAMLFTRFAQGTALGCVLMAAASAIDY